MPRCEKQDIARVTLEHRSQCAAFHCPDCGRLGGVNPEYKYCLWCGVRYEFDEDARKWYVSRVNALGIKQRIRRARERYRDGHIFVSDVELESFGINGVFDVGYEVMYNDVPHLLMGICRDGVRLIKKGE